MHKLFKRLIKWAYEKAYRDKIKLRQEDTQGLLDALSEARVKLSYAEGETEAMRALLCQLRVRQTNEGGRIGWAVQAFIPDEVLDRLRKRPHLVKRFIFQVSDKLVVQALKGIEKVTQPGNRVCAIMFEKIGDQPIISAMKENAKRPTIFKLKKDGSRDKMVDLPGQTTRNIFARLENAPDSFPAALLTIENRKLLHNADENTNG